MLVQMSMFLDKKSIESIMAEFEPHSLEKLALIGAKDKYTEPLFKLSGAEKVERHRPLQLCECEQDP